MHHIVVVGAGQAGSTLVVKLRNLGFDGPITLIGQEPVPPYQRPPLSKGYLLGEMQLSRLFLKPESFYEAQNIDLRLGSAVTEIDPVAKTLVLGNDMIHYDQLAITTGSAPRRLPTAIGGDLQGVHVVRSLADVDAMAADFSEDKHALIVGGGYIGLEAAAVARKRGVRVTLVEMADRILGRVAARETSDYFRALHRAHGVDILEGLGLERLLGDSRVRAARFDDGREIDVDFVVAGVGITPDTALANSAGLVIENGIRTDAQGRTSDASIWAAGDCTSFPYKGTRIRLESVPNAIDQAEIVAANMLGAETDYTATPWFWSDQYDVKLQIAGLNTGYDTVVTRPGSKDGMVSFWYYLGDELLAVDAMNDPRSYMIGKRLIDAGKSPARTMAGDPEADLKPLLKT